jgi:hypothetical protein
MEELKHDVQRGKITRTVRLTPEVDAKLVRLAEELGTSVNAYLNVEMGKAINRDFLSFQVADRQGAAMDNFMQTALAAMQTQIKDGEDAE